MKHLLIVTVFIGMKTICAFAGIHQSETAVYERMDTIIPVPDFSMSGYAAITGNGLETTTGGLGGDTIIIETLQELIDWGKAREDNITPETVLIRGSIEADPTEVVTIKRGGNISILGDTTGGGNVCGFKKYFVEYSRSFQRNHPELVGWNWRFV